MRNDAITVLVRYRTLAGQESRATQELAALIATVTAIETACLGITMLRDAADPTSILLIEHWTDRETFVGPHLQQPHIQAFMQQAGAFLAGPPEITFWHRLPATAR